MNTATKPMYEWKDINWRKAERCVFKLQKRIFKASQRGDVKLVHKLQRLLLKSWYAKRLAVRRVSQDNQGKKTAGVDGIKSLTPKQRMALVKNLKLGNKSKPTRRVWIPKPNTDERRPLGIPTMYERALQALVKLALEPEWEAKFEPNSYGFRPARSAHDAIGAIYLTIKQKAKYVLDADISKCFDKINHQKLLKKLQTYPSLRRQIKAWLKCGVMDGKSLFPSQEGTPQGGVISPLLANIALHGMEERVKQYAKTLKGDKTANSQALSMIRYADDFVVIHKNLQVIERCKKIIESWLNEMGLELKLSKTKITHTLTEHEGNIGFDFLGFNIRQYKVGKNRSGSNKGGKLGFKTLIKPSAEKVKTHLRKLREIVEKSKVTTQATLIKRLNPIIRGWSK
jgi:RNA-directed DNA polymerase